MLGYDLLANANLEYWNMLMLVGASAVCTFTGSMALKEDNSLNTTVNGKREIFIRRYEVNDGKLTKFYNKMWVPITYGNYYNSPVKGLAPEGTTWEYLSCKKEWGFTEEIPPAPVVIFMSDGMQPEVDKILQNK